MAGFFATKGKQAAPQQPRGPALMQAALTSQALRDRIAAFQKIFEPQIDILTGGQFLFGDQLEQIIRTRADVLLLDPQKKIAISELLDDAINDKALDFALGNASDIVKDGTNALAFTLSDDLRAQMNAIIGDDAVKQLFPTPDIIKSTIASVVTVAENHVANQMSNTDISIGTIPIKGEINIYHYIVAMAHCAEKCFTTCGRVTAVHRLRSGIPVQKSGRMGTMVSSAVNESAAFMQVRRLGFVNPRVVNYRSPGTNPAMLNTLIATVANGTAVRVGVMSGQAYDKPLAMFPTPEHYLVIIGALPLSEFQAVAFPFWDPDVQTTKIVDGSGNPYPHPFGLLFAFYEPDPDTQADRLFFSTGSAVSDLIYKAPSLAHDMDFHPTFKTRHRYQVVSLFNP